MGITRAVIGAVAAAGVARLLAPKETDRAVKAVKRTVSSGVKSVEHEVKSMMPGRAKTAAARTKKTVKATAKKATKAVSKVRKGARRPARKSGG